MRKSIKNKILIPLVLLFTLSVALFGAINFMPKSVDASFVGSATEIRVDQGENAKKGMRFVSELPKDLADSYLSEGYTVSYGTFIMPAYYADADHKKQGLTEESLFGENPSYIFDQNEDASLDPATRPWKILNAVCPDPELVEGVYLIKASINMNIAENLNTKYTARAYLKAVKGEEVLYVLAETPAADKSLLDVAVSAMDAMPEFLDTINGFINSYEAAGGNVNVTYQIAHKYTDSSEVDLTTVEARIGDAIDIAPYLETAGAVLRNYNYYYYNNADLGLLRATPDGNRIVVKFDAKKSYSNSSPKIIGLYQLTSDNTDREPVAESFSVELSGDRVATVTFAELSSLKAGTTHTIAQFPEDEPVVYEFKVTPYTAEIDDVNDFSHFPKLSSIRGQVYYGNAEYFIVTKDIDMTGYKIPIVAGTSYHASGYEAYGFRGDLDGNGHVLYNLTTRFIDVLGVHSVMRNLTIIGTSPKTGANGSMALITRVVAGTITNCHFDITVPADLDFNGTIDTMTARYGATPVFDASKTVTLSGTTYVPKIQNTIIRVNDLSGKITSALGTDCATSTFTNSYLFTDSVAYETAPTNANARIIECGLNDAFTGDQEKFGSSWTFDSKLPALYGRVVSHASTDFEAYTLNSTKDGRDANANDAAVLADGIVYAVPNASVMAQAVGSKTYLVTTDDDYGIITVNKVTALISDKEDVQYFLYLAGGGTDASILDTNYDKFGANELFVLTKNIDMTGITPVLGKPAGTGGTYGKYGFHGTLDGNGFTITNLNAPLFANLGNGSIVKNLSIVADGITSSSFSTTAYGKVDNCLFDYTVPGSTLYTITNYAYGSYWTNCVFKINSLSTVANKPQTVNATYLSKTVQRWFMTNSIVLTNSPGWYSDTGTEGLGAAPTVRGLDGLTTSDVSNFIANGGNSAIWNNDLGFKTLNVVETIDGAWAKYNYTDENCTSRVANTETYEGIAFDKLNALQVGSLYSVPSVSGNVYNRSMVRIATIVAKTPKQLSNLIYGCGGTAGQAATFIGYIVVGADLDMTGVTFSLAQSAWSGHHYNDRSFDGVLDGFGYTVSNFTGVMFLNLGGTNGAIVRNLNLVDANGSITGTLGKVTFENCNLDFVNTTIAKHGSAQVLGVIGDSVANGNVVNVIDTTVSVLNMTGSTMYVVKDNTDDGSGGSINFVNSSLLAESKNVSVTGFDNSTQPILGENSKKYYEETEILYYGRWALDKEQLANGVYQKIYNKYPLEGTLSGGDYVKFDDIVAKLGIASDSTNANIDPYGTSSRYTYANVKGSKGNYYKAVKIVSCYASIGTVDDIVHLDALLVADGYAWASLNSKSYGIGFNNDIDMAGIDSITRTTSAVASSPSAEDASWGWQGTLYGNNKTVYNLNYSLLGYTHSNAVVKDLNFVNMGANGCITQACSGGTFENLTFDIDAKDMSNIYIVSRTNNIRGSASTGVVFKNSTINVKNASSTFEVRITRGPNKGYTPAGFINAESINVTMDAGSLVICQFLNGTWPQSVIATGPVTNKVVSGTVTCAAAGSEVVFTNTTPAE